MLFIIILFILGFILITKGADIFINYTVIIGKKTNISELVLGATIVSFATTLPELTVSTVASLQGHTTMSLGNAVGSIICNTGLVLGLVAFISPFKVDKNMFFSKSIILLISVFLTILLSIDGNINRIDALLLLLMLLVYMYTNYKSVEKDSKTDLSKNYNRGSINIKETLKIAVFFILGLVMMVLGSKLLVDNGIKIAEIIGIPQGIISLTVIALGTSLPELVSSITAIRKKHHAISVGNVLGANILNIVSVIGISAIPNDIPILAQTAKIDFPFMIALLLILIIPTIKKHKLHRWQGMLMLSTYLLYMATLYYIYIVA
ncbi:MULTISPECIES: calcium/sodium antiporter [Romboutsia]|uniref:Ca2+/Na+ antiporter n=1 Tax=Romboutsia hominis TaxID=1507512 RepID=A0A2P2BUD1_9FIRM|nr:MULTISPECIES: calcium/sodium antiporter [Romboutsia]MDB8789575.1 calcium/sodium antiporter [Romboutsia sp. 1001216sp1]MDB8793819.1 calcium/sodium antiporter [Romboutsia sp. 1001216sp1]MDB8796722.1 calcium/sodium antiporter [Romboutsia sp. 1001216sp1]MDB8799927.1 calcium/sodium antiporter [Romboutsia sp. 1001216sp1]MDB8802718.1 calcium/sodium antiporter [Romboutsia sp. 1001216sp1]